MHLNRAGHGKLRGSRASDCDVMMWCELSVLFFYSWSAFNFILSGGFRRFIWMFSCVKKEGRHKMYAAH
jgi:hypothetical protein